ncbi:mediator complex subunit 13 C-terminal-domain-containing protein [Zychaea mexicana]|uniref:mediator complex subunit 13 C-terminal-domain-containing protein n=1 Tax=Zychaea mexicana TaxID=64656 RepID=UPI0022FF0D1C|nr:mediator complex subunit 13 C-terminal-domain-containing protein [Zychaea mexicana]KAI9496107.1 mediator complex subunit 13 C-terminal-domain-containing protein [Zychaea mexicana]
MLTDSSLTNIFLVSGASQIRYRVYCQRCQRSQLASFLKTETAGSSSSSSSSASTTGGGTDDDQDKHLVRAFRQLVQLGIPCTWRIITTQQEDQVTLELWVFWFDDRRTGEIDDNISLQNLEETKMGSFTWESAVAKSLSPTASPRTPSTSTSSSVLSVSVEYRLFIKAIKSLIRGSMVRKGAMPLGEFFIFPSTFMEGDVCSDIFSTTPDPSVATLLTCTYNIYLTNTNLVVQPDIHRIKLRPITTRDLDTAGTSVLICPYGEQATIIRAKHGIPNSMEEQVLHHWSSLLDIPLRALQQHQQHHHHYPHQHKSYHQNHHYTNSYHHYHNHNQHYHHHNLSSNGINSSSNSSSNSSNSKKNEYQLPPLVPLRMSKTGDIVLYPTHLTYISTSASISPVSMGGMNGILGYNQGYAEDLGEKWSRWAWADQIREYARRNRHHPNVTSTTTSNNSSNDNVNFWDYGSPKMSATAAVLDTLSIAEMGNFQGVLQKALNETVGSSPIMVSKAVATPASSGPKMEPSENDQCTPPDKSRAERFQHQSELSIADFAKLHFGEDEDEQQQQQQQSGTASMIEGVGGGNQGAAVTEIGADFAGHRVNANGQQREGATTTTANSKNVLQPLPQQQQTTPAHTASGNNNRTLTDSSVLLSGVSDMVLNSGDPTQAYPSSSSPTPIAASDDAFGFRLGIDGLDGANNMYGSVTSNRWGDPMEDLDNLDFNVTEEDFDFFEPVKEDPAAAAAALFGNNHSNVLDEQHQQHQEDQQQELQVEKQEQQTNANDTLMLLDMTDIGNEEINLDALFSKDVILDDDSLLMPNETAASTITTDATVKAESGDNIVPQQQQHPEDDEAMTVAMDTVNTTAADDNQSQQQKPETVPAGMLSPSPPLPSSSLPPMVLESKSEQHFVPPAFAPIKFPEGVNDAKYSEGGKFMYMPTPKDEDDKAQIKQRNKLKRDNYRPDYVPRLRKRPRIKRHHASATATTPTHRILTGSPITPTHNNTGSLVMYRSAPTTVTSTTLPTTAPAVAPTTAMTSASKKIITAHTFNQVPENITNHVSSINDNEKLDDGDDTSSTTTAETSSSSSTSSDGSAYSSNRSSNDEPDWWMATTRSTQTVFINQFFKKQQEQSIQSMINFNRMMLEFDSPFPSTTAYGPLTSVRSFQDLDKSQEVLKVLDYLCQQVVMGGYPFTSGLTAVSANGGEIPRDESSTVLVARRRALLQRCQGDVMHVPSLPSDYDRVAQDFKSVLSDLFDHTKIVTDTMDQLNVMPSTVAVKGPLSVQQYYDLSEASQAQSKYGKFNVKKRRPAEPNLDTLTPPDIVVGRQDEFLEGSPKLVTFWEKLRLEPYSAHKNIRYFAVFPSNEQLEPICTHFFKSLSTVYETCHLGVHQPGSIGTYRRGLVPVPLLPESAGESWSDRQMRSYSAECQNLGLALGGAMVENMHIVIYIVNPTHNLSSNLELSRCFHKLMLAYHAASMGNISACQERRARLVFQLVPLEHILRPSSFGGYPNFGLKEVAFSVYSKCHTVVGRNHTQHPGMEDTRPATLMYSPPFILAKPIPDTIQYSLKNTVNSFPIILDQSATLHMAYCFSLDRQWMVLVWTDNQGELLEFSVIHIKDKSLLDAVDEAWQKTKDVAQCTGFAWTFVIAKIGLMFGDELQAWIDVIPADDKVAIVSVDIDSALRVQLNHDLANQYHQQQQQQIPVMEYPQTPGSSANTPTPETFSSAAASTATTPLSAAAASTAAAAATVRPAASALDLSNANGEIKALILNHRVAYSRHRTHVMQGIVNADYGGTACGDGDSDQEHWMLPLATGYLICSSPKTENPLREQFNSEPLVMDVHLVYNQTGPLVYSTLRDIIKRYHALSFISMTPSSSSNCLPLHLVIAERLQRILLVMDTA